MVLDSSIVLAILLDEPEAVVYAKAIEQSEVRLVSTSSVLEMSLVLERKYGRDGTDRIDAFLQKVRAEIIPFDREQLHFAREGFRRYGRGRHPAGLNFGDCFSYALSKATGEPLLYKGEDFSKTDVASALSR